MRHLPPLEHLEQRRAVRFAGQDESFGAHAYQLLGATQLFLGVAVRDRQDQRVALITQGRLYGCDELGKDRMFDGRDDRRDSARPAG